MPPEISTINHSPLPDLCIERPQSSFSAISDATTFYSAHDLPPSRNFSDNSYSSLNYEEQNSIKVMRILQKNKLSQNSILSKLSRQDSGYEGNTTSTLSSFKMPSPRSLRSENKFSSRSSSPHNIQNSYKFSISHAPLRHSHTHGHCRQQQVNSSRTKNMRRRHHQQIRFSQFASFSQDGLNPEIYLSDDEFPQPLSPPPIPSTTHYWTSDSSRRLEYAAIDAASSGVRGFLVRLVPDCMLPAQTRRTRFWEHDNEKGRKEGSVRRYRLALPEEPSINEAMKEKRNINSLPRQRGAKRPGLLRRWSTGLKIGRN